MIQKVFLEHPRSVDEGYFEHMAMALGFGWRLVTCGLACMIHALVPALFKKTASREVAELYECMCRQRNRKAPPVSNYQI